MGQTYNYDGLNRLTVFGESVLGGERRRELDADE